MKRRFGFGRLEMIAFIAGFALMAYELVAARILAPSIGSSTYVWTSIIGIIIAALSVGYFLGGKLADARNAALDVVVLCFVAAGAVILTLFLNEPVLELIVVAIEDPRLQGVVAALLLFAPASFVLGMLSPYLAKLNVRSLATSGRSVASLSALNSVGGIIGTFFTGFVLFGYIGSIETLKVIVLLLLAASWLIVPRRQVVERIVLTIGLGGLLLVSPSTLSSSENIDTPSAHYQVINGTVNNRQIVGLVTGPGGTQSAVYKDGSDDLVFWYNRMFAKIILEQQPGRILVLGGGAFTLPEYLAEQLPDSQIDVVEIDPELHDISEQYFGYTNPANVRLVFEDARTFLNQTVGTYDIVVVDTYGDAGMPFTLTTTEYTAQLAQHVEPEGMVLVNVIGGTTVGACRDILAALHMSYSQQFKHSVYANKSGRAMYRANHVVVYSRHSLNINGMEPLMLPDVALFRDDYAPIERLFFDCKQG
ncbi:MAG: fused MFS/spermidine synthase [Candidatus Saccharimonadales bacterium]